MNSNTRIVQISKKAPLNKMYWASNNSIFVNVTNKHRRGSSIIENSGSDWRLTLDDKL